MWQIYERDGGVTALLRSCVNDRVVWIYHGTTRQAVRLAYWKVCRKEIERMRNWPATAAARMEPLERLLAVCTASMSGVTDPTPAQKEALRTLRTLCRRPPECDTDFYDHIVEERRRRAEDREIRRRMRERDAERAAREAAGRKK